jgi:hypothetical protein
MHIKLKTDEELVDMSLERMLTSRSFSTLDTQHAGLFQVARVKDQLGRNSF